MRVCVCACVTVCAGALRSQKRASGFVGRELRAVVSRLISVLGTALRSLTRAAHTLTCWATAPVLNGVCRELSKISTIVPLNTVGSKWEVAWAESLPCAHQHVEIFADMKKLRGRRQKNVPQGRHPDGLKIQNMTSITNLVTYKSNSLNYTPW